MRALEGEQGKKEYKYKKQEITVLKAQKSVVTKAKQGFTVLASIALGFPAEHKRMRETRTPQFYLPRLSAKKRIMTPQCHFCLTNREFRGIMMARRVII